MATPASPPASRRRGSAAKSAPTAAPATQPAIDQLLGDLERVVGELEAGELPLEQALARFEEGVRLARQGGLLLDAVEQRVEMLLEGSDAVAPFPGGAGPNDDDDHEDDGDDDDDV